MKSEEPSHLMELKNLLLLQNGMKVSQTLTIGTFLGSMTVYKKVLMSCSVGVLLSGSSQHLNPDDLMLGASFRHFHHMFVT